MGVPPKTESKLIKVKIITPFSDRWFLHQIPQDMRWANCLFTLNRSDQKYDWLVAYNNIPGAIGNCSKKHCEEIRCPAEHTMLTTTEPSSISHYGKAFTGQFGCVLTSQEPWALPHRDRIHQQAGLIWLYGIGYEGEAQSFENMIKNPPIHKKHDLSLVFSEKKMRMTLHRKRFKFMQEMENHFPEMHIFGRSQGHTSLDDKTNALAPYRYSFALENHIEKHHWTEKLADAFLGLTLPFYAGCPNASDYFPEESFIPVSLKDPRGAVRVIKKAINAGEYEKRLPAIYEARRRVLYQHNLFAVLAREIEKRHDPNRLSSNSAMVCSRHAVRAKSPFNWLNDISGKVHAKLRRY